MRLKIDGLHDPGTAAAIKRVLNQVAGITGIEMDAELGMVVLKGDPSEDLVLTQPTEEGFEARMSHDAPLHPRHGTVR